MSEKVWCIQGQHFVPIEKMSFLPLPKGGRRRLCEDCKAEAMERRTQERNAKFQGRA